MESSSQQRAQSPEPRAPKLGRETRERQSAPFMPTPSRPHDGTNTVVAPVAPGVIAVLGGCCTSPWPAVCVPVEYSCRAVLSAVRNPSASSSVRSSSNPTICSSVRTVNDMVGSSQIWSDARMSEQEEPVSSSFPLSALPGSNLSSLSYPLCSALISTSSGWRYAASDGSGKISQSDQPDARLTPPKEGLVFLADALDDRMGRPKEI